MDADRRKSLLQLWAESEAPPEIDDEVPEHLLTKPLRRLNAGELWYLIGRNAGLEQLAPLAVEKLADDPLLKAQQYPGDLLVALMESRSAFWTEHYDLWLETIGLLEAAVKTITELAEKGELGEYMPNYLGDDFMGALMHFRGIHEG